MDAPDSIAQKKRRITEDTLYRYLNSADSKTTDHSTGPTTRATINSASAAPMEIEQRQSELTTVAAPEQTLPAKSAGHQRPSSTEHVKATAQLQQPSTAPMTMQDARAPRAPHANDEAAAVQETDTFNDDSTDLDTALRIIDNTERYYIQTKHITTHGFKTTLSRDHVIQEARYLVSAIGHAIDEGEFRDSMDEHKQWQIDLYDGQYAVIIPLLFEATFQNAYRHHCDFMTQPTYTYRCGNTIVINEGA